MVKLRQITSKRDLPAGEFKGGQNSSKVPRRKIPEIATEIRKSSAHLRFFSLPINRTALVCTLSTLMAGPFAAHHHTRNRRSCEKR